MMRRQHDGVAVWSLTDRFSQQGRVLAEKGLSEELISTQVLSEDGRSGLAAALQRDGLSGAGLVRRGAVRGGESRL